jgi:UDP-2-acetamido-3-amino-2,3-dideoxy-glucuronate N-acetyltransferase
MRLLDASDIAPGLLLAPGVKIPDDAEIDPRVTIYGGVVLGAGVRLGHGSVIGRPQRIDANSRSPRQPPGAPTFIGPQCMVGGGATIVAGARIGARTAVADLALVRETAVVGDEVMIGRGSIVSRTADIGAGTRIQAGAIIGPRSQLGTEVMVGPHVVFIGDPTLGRSIPEIAFSGIRVGHGARICTGAILCPPLESGSRPWSEPALSCAPTSLREPSWWGLPLGFCATSAMTSCWTFAGSPPARRASGSCRKPSLGRKQLIARAGRRAP